MKLVILLLCFHICFCSSSHAQSHSSDSASLKEHKTDLHIIDSILLTNSVIRTHSKMHIFAPPVSIADPAFLKQYNVNQVIIDSTLQTGRIPDIPASEIYNMTFLIDVEKDKSNLSNTLIIVTRSFIRQQYWRSFSASSVAYRNAVPAPEKFNNFTYYINGNAIKTSLEEELTKISAKSIVKIKVDNEGVKIKTNK